MLRMLVCCLIFATPAYAIEFSSPEQKATVIELYTSEGCSSCPPADAWLSQLRNSPELFNSIVPLAFHVDYWDQLGWKDRFAQSRFTQQQQQMVEQGLLSQVYTPGILVNNHEWVQWFRGVRTLPAQTESAGRLRVHIEGSQLEVFYSKAQALTLHVAYLGMGLSSRVTAGENHGKTLHHDFVVLTDWQQSGQSRWNMALPDIPRLGQQQTAIAVWITKPNSLQIIQATGHVLMK